MCTLLQSAHETQMRLGRPWLTEKDIWAAEQTANFDDLNIPHLASWCSHIWIIVTHLPHWAQERMGHVVCPISIQRPTSPALGDSGAWAVSLHV